MWAETVQSANGRQRKYWERDEKRSNNGPIPRSVKVECAEYKEVDITDGQYKVIEFTFPHWKDNECGS